MPLTFALSLTSLCWLIHEIRSQQQTRNTSVERGADAAQRQLSVEHIDHQKGQHGNTDIEHNGDQELIGKNQPSGQPSDKSTDPLGIGFSREYGLLAAASAAHHAFGEADALLAEGSRPNAECRCSGPQAHQEAAQGSLNTSMTAMTAGRASGNMSVLASTQRSRRPWRSSSMRSNGPGSSSIQ